MSRFKTELCNNLIELGSCKYGDRCHYAHGAHELRQVSRRHPKYRTERCKNFELTGKCPFGPRCSYVHPKPDLDSMIEQLTKYMKHTKAPKPDSEDDDDFSSLPFTRTNTSSSALDSMATSSNPTTDDENKENQQERVYKAFNPVISRRNISSPLKTIDLSSAASLTNQQVISRRNITSHHQNRQSHNHHYQPLKTIDLSTTLTDDHDPEGDDDETDGDNNENQYHRLKQLTNQKRSPLSSLSNKQFQTRF